MAKQVKLPEMAEDVESYFRWLNRKSGIGCPEVAKILYETDFRWLPEIEDDKNRAEDGLKWRDRYAEEANKGLEKKQEKWIRKSIHGVASCYEVILSLAEDIDAMVNDSEESRTAEFFGILMKNMGLDGYDDEDFDYRGEAAKAEISGILRRWMDHDDENGTKNCPFPVTVSVTLLKKCDKKVSQNASLWQKMNDWVGENMDENGHL